jgi:hypothetical protein
MDQKANRLGHVGRVGPLLVFGVVMLLLAPGRSLPGLAQEGHSRDGDGTGGAVVAGDGTGGINANTGVATFPCQRFILPIYPSNTGEWDRAVSSNIPSGSILILNQGGTRAGDDPYAEKGGPGFEPDPALQERVKEAQERGFLVLGYVRTGATGSNSGPRRDREMTDLEIADLKAWYGVDGIFYDEVWADGRYFAYYQDLVAHGREMVPGLHVFNSGGSPSDIYAPLADVIGTFEGRADDFRTWAPSTWQRNYPPSKWAAVVMSVSDAAEMRSVIWLSRTNNLGYIYMTNRFGTQFENPWTHLPTFWPDLVAQVLKCATDSDSFLGG